MTTTSETAQIPVRLAFDSFAAGYSRAMGHLDQAATKEEILGFLQGKIAKWWMPDDVAFVEDIPHTATGKIQKTTLRDRFKDYILPTEVAAE